MLCKFGQRPYSNNISQLLCIASRNSLLKSSSFCQQIFNEYSRIPFLNHIGSHCEKRIFRSTHFTKLKSQLQHLGLSTSCSSNNWHSVTYIKSDGQRLSAKGKDGDSLLDVAINNSIDLDGFGACEGTLSCSTCHLIFKKEDFDKIPDPASDEELDMLDLAFGLTDTPLSFKSIALAGSGFLSPYLSGACTSIQKCAPGLLEKTPLCGASSGALVAACLACGVPLHLLEESVLSVARELRQHLLGAFSPGFNIEAHLRRGLELLPPDAHELVSGRLFVSLTRARDGRNVVASEWVSRDELIQCLLCSCFIPLFSGLWCPPTFRGVTYLDGGFSDNLPIYAHPALTISPFAGDALICPPSRYRGNLRIRVGNHAAVPTPANFARFWRSLFPPPTAALEVLRREGYVRASAFFSRVFGRSGTR